MKTNDQYEAEFRQYLQEIGYSKGSQKLLSYCVNEFLKHCNTINIEEINPKQIVNFYQHLQQRVHKKTQLPLSEIFISHHLYSLRVFFNWLQCTNQLEANPISNLKFKRPTLKQRQPLSQEEIKELFAQTENLKEIAILHLFYSCGLRRSEAVSLNITDIHFYQNILYIRKGKGAKRRAIPMTFKVSKELEKYLVVERPKDAEKEAFILNAKGERMLGQNYNRILKKLLEKSGIYHLKSNISLHHLRHSIATHLLENGLSIDFVREFLGHSGLETTQIYTKVNLKKYSL